MPIKFSQKIKGLEKMVLETHGEGIDGSKAKTFEPNAQQRETTPEFFLF